MHKKKQEKDRMDWRKTLDGKFRITFPGVLLFLVIIDLMLMTYWIIKDFIL